MRLLTVILLLVTSIHLSLAQDDIKSWEFFHKLHASTILQDSTDIRINPDSINQIVFKDGKARLGIDTVPAWRFVYEYQYGWRETIGMQKYKTIDTLTFIMPFRTEYTNIYLPTGDSNVYCGGELFSRFEFKPLYLHDNSMRITGFPEVPDRYALLNMTWVPIISGEYLLIRFVQSYPFGNQTSFYNEFILYFKMVNACDQ